MELTMSYSSRAAELQRKPDLMQSLFGISGFRDNQKKRAWIANALIEKAGITDKEVANYIESRYADTNYVNDVSSGIFDYGTAVFVYLYVRERVEDLMWSELNRGFPDSLITCGGFLNTDSRYELDKQDKEDLLADCAIIKDRSRFVLWFIDQIKCAGEPLYLDDYEDDE